MSADGSVDGAAVRKMRDGGMSWSAIARELEATAHAVRAAYDPEYVNRNRARCRERYSRVSEVAREPSEPRPISLARVPCLEKPFPWEV